MRLPDKQSVAARYTELFGPEGLRFFDAPGPEFSDPDAALLAEEEIASSMALIMDEAFRQGVVGYAQDVFVQGHPWFDPSAIRAPMIVAQGDLDTVIPVAHSRHTAELVPGASLRILPGHGYISILAVLSDLLAEAADRR